MPGGRRLVVDSATSLAPMPADNQFALAERACGLGEDYRITPLRAAMLAAAVANHGQLMRPCLIKEVRNIAGEVIASNSPALFHQVMSAETAEKLKDYMIDTTERGIGRKAKVSGVLVAGKTGTARTNKKQKGLDAWFICFAPADKPQVAIAVLAEDEGKGMEVAAPIARSVIQDLIQ
jgi:peptidoglycan glycosyltransferase